MAGSVATAFSFLAMESRWRHALPALFPGDELTRSPASPRLPVRVRLLGIFLLISVIPLAILGVLAYTRALALVGADVGTPPRRWCSDLRTLILFLLAVGILSAVGLAGFAAHSVADPLGKVQEAMADVAAAGSTTAVPCCPTTRSGRWRRASITWSRGCGSAR